MNIAFASNSPFGAVVFKKLLENGITPSFLITSSATDQKKRTKAQNLLLRDLARERGVEIREAEDRETMHKIIEEKRPELVVTAACGIIISQETLSLSTFINVHPSLLPEYRGATPIQNAIIDGKEKTGVSVIKMNEKIDGGPILSQKEVSLMSKITYEEAEKLLAEEGGDLLLDVIPSALKDELTFTEQNEEEATYTKTLKKEDGKINWSDPAKDIERKVRALNPWPGTYGKMGEKTFKVLDAEVQEQTTDGPFGDPGKVYLGTNNSIAVQTGKNFLLIKRLQIEGKNSTTSKDFLQGNMQSIGITLS